MGKAISHRRKIRDGLWAFVKKWKNETREEAEAQSFWEDFFRAFGLERRSVAIFEHSVEREDKSKGYIDLFWKGVLLVEHKSRGKSLDKAKSQAFDYCQNIKNQRDKPRYVLLSDFATFKLFDLEQGTEREIAIEDLPNNIEYFKFMSGLENHGTEIQEVELNIEAAERLGRLYDALQEANQGGDDLDVFLVRILFCLFAEDTGIFEHLQFYNFILNFTEEDGSDTDLWIHKLFQVLDQHEDKRSQHLLEELNFFPYVNGDLFKNNIDLPTFNEEMREALIDCALFDWSSISPAIFGSLFQSVMDKAARRELGAHYTSETNILRLIDPLFLDDLKADFVAIQKLRRGKQKKLLEFQQKLTNLQFFDPACGCGNFLIITYRELRRLELKALYEQHGDSPNISLDIAIEPTINLNHFHGIEIEEFPSRIAEVAMWLTQHQMNREFAKQFGVEPELLPLRSAANIVNENALQVDWEAVVKPEKLDYIIGNPPFRGSKMQSKEQKKELSNLFLGIKNAKQLDYVSCWFRKSAIYIREHEISIAFVSTNSITMGEQVAPLWNLLVNRGFSIDFAHRTFSWNSEAKGKAAVHVIIIGYSKKKNKNKYLFTYSNAKGEPIKVNAKNINPYLFDASDIVVESANHPICDVPPMWFGNMPLDGGNLLLSPKEKNDLLEKEPNARKWIKPVLGAREFLNNGERWCLWLTDVTPKELRKMPYVMERVQAVKDFRLSSKARSTQIHASRPTEFRDVRLPKTYILVPGVSSERREYIPMGFFNNDIVPTNATLIIPEATLYHFGILESEMHMDWMRTVCGRLKSDYRYSAKLVYNNFPWPDADKKQIKKVENSAQKILDIREKYPDSSLADLYDALVMPADLRKAHKALDRAVEQCYRTEKFKNDMDRLSFLFERYAELTGTKTDQPTQKKIKTAKRRKIAEPA